MTITGVKEKAFFEKRDVIRIPLNDGTNGYSPIEDEYWENITTLDGDIIVIDKDCYRLCKEKKDSGYNGMMFELNIGGAKVKSMIKHLGEIPKKFRCRLKPNADFSM